MVVGIVARGEVDDWEGKGQRHDMEYTTCYLVGRFSLFSLYFGLQYHETYVSVRERVISACELPRGRRMNVGAYVPS